MVAECETLRRRGLLLENCEAEGEGEGLAVLAASAVGGTTPPVGGNGDEALPFERRLDDDDP